MNKRGKKPGSPKTGGRKPGTPNKIATHAKEIIQRFSPNLDPVQCLCYIMANNEKALGYNGPQIKFGKDGQVIEVPWFTPEMRLEAARTLAKKIYPDLKAVEVSQDPESPQPAQFTVTKDLLLDLAKKAHAK